MDILEARSLHPEAQQDLHGCVVRAIEAGLTVTAATAFGVHRSTAISWYHASLRRGAPALQARPRDRMPSTLLDSGQRARLLDVLTTQIPDQLGLPDPHRTRNAAAD